MVGKAVRKEDEVVVVDILDASSSSPSSMRGVVVNGLLCSLSRHWLFAVEASSSSPSSAQSQSQESSQEPRKYLILAEGLAHTQSSYLHPRGGPTDIKATVDTPTTTGDSRGNSGGAQARTLSSKDDQRTTTATIMQSAGEDKALHVQGSSSDDVWALRWRPSSAGDDHAQASMLHRLAPFNDALDLCDEGATTTTKRGRRCKDNISKMMRLPAQPEDNAGYYGPLPQDVIYSPSRTTTMLVLHEGTHGQDLQGTATSLAAAFSRAPACSARRKTISKRDGFASSYKIARANYDDERG
ncbi:hypothetical protein BDZ89DRAFT_1190633 [Hymenopellis radicata]|nr:hypothetical protein BDZ89DRAFT_1190633 [Hymenopellis radicata]